ncbi:MAG TPA: macrolide family glycosyltransferase, partial [Herpetosiphonaceae bacterium]
MPTAIMFSLPAHGHVNPTLPLMAELARRGERIICYANEPFRRSIEAAGAIYRAYAEAGSFDPNASLGGPFGLMARSAELAEQMLPGLLADVEAERPDYLLIDSMCLWGNLVQQITGLPAIASYSSFAMHPKMFGALRGDNPGPPLGDMLRGLPLLARYWRICRRIDRRHGTKTPGPAGFFGTSQQLNLIYTSRMFQPLAAEFDERFAFTGPSVAERHDAGDFPLDALGAPLIYISLGTIFNDALPFYRACFDAFGGSRHQIVLSVGQTIDLAALGEPPANFVVRRHVPQLEILRRADLFVSHGGMNSASESLLYGVPLLVVPQIGDQFFVAARVRELGAGLSLANADIAPERLRLLAETILAEPSFRRQAAKLGASLREAGGFERAADEVQAF